MKENINKHIPENARDKLDVLIKQFDFNLKITPNRKSRRGDFKIMPGQKMHISVNGSLNEYEFLLTLVLEIAHMKTYLY